jgi:tetratricopeptide (TPR) repeat protein/S1-C subfamily serine protease
MKDILTKYVHFDRSLKGHSLLAFLTVGTFAVSAMLPWMAVARGEAETIEANGVLTLATAQQAAAKITVRVRMGQGGGSGVLLAKKGGTYLVLTNAHVVQGQASVSITTPDGQVHGARRVPNAQVGDFDLALLEFNSARAYHLAGLANFETRGGAKLTEKDPVFAAGFPYDANGLKLLGGKITQLPQEAFKNGTQVGYVTQGDLVQGMSGGPVLDSFGNLVGINSTLARPVIDSYVYADGSKAPDDKVAEYRQANWSVPMYNLLTRLNPDVLYSYQQLPKLHRSVTPTGYMADLDRKARAVTVRIEKSSGGNGSGVIVAKDNNAYYVLTNEHVVTRKVHGSNEKFVTSLKITTADQRSYEIATGDIKRYEGTDLAIVKFTSSHLYKVAILGDYTTANGIVFAGGWPSPQNINSQQWQWQLNPGTIQLKDYGEFLTQDKKSFDNGYDLIYRSITYGGMSGGGVFDISGRVIGIHGKAEGIREDIFKPEVGSILGSSLGISIQNFIGVADKLGVSSSQLQISKDSLSSLVSSGEIQAFVIDLAKRNTLKPININTAEQWVEHGNQLDRLGNSIEAVKAFNRAITLRPNLLNAYYGKGIALYNDKEWSDALKSFDRAIALVPLKDHSNYYYLWRYRGVLLSNLQRYPESLVAISKAISLDPHDTVIQFEMVSTLIRMNRFSEAIKKIDEITINKKGQRDWTYIARGVIRYRLKDKKRAFSDLDKAIEINTRSILGYLLRGFLKYKEGDKTQALSDFNSIIDTNPDLALGYALRGLFKADEGDEKGAFYDLDRAIEISPNSAESYAIRGNIKFKIGDKKDAFSDLNKAINIDPKLALSYFYRGDAKSELKDYQGAVFDYDKAIKINPHYAEAYFNRGDAKSELEDYQGAVFDYGKVIDANPENAYAYTKRGSIRSKIKDYRGAVLDYDEVIKINPSEAINYLYRGLVKADSGDRRGAVSDYWSLD